jgi:polar amino acid transport system substrate-binding protein
MRVLAAAIGVGLALLAGCQYPRDPQGTLDQVEGGTMRVGVIDDPPWASLAPDGEPRGVEPELVRQFAAELDAEIEWIEGPAADLVEAMRGFQIDLLIGGLTRDSRYSNDVALTRPYVDTEIQFATPPGEQVPDDLDGREVWVERASEAASLLQQEEVDATALEYERIEEVDGLALLHTYEIDELGFERSDRIQRDDEHAMAVPLGENAFLVELEHFLLDRGSEAEDLLHEEVSR